MALEQPPIGPKLPVCPTEAWIISRESSGKAERLMFRIKVLGKQRLPMTPLRGQP